VRPTDGAAAEATPIGTAEVVDDREPESLAA
jgi:hypothetical protein